MLRMILEWMNLVRVGCDIINLIADEVDDQMKGCLKKNKNKIAANMQ